MDITRVVMMSPTNAPDLREYLYYYHILGLLSLPHFYAKPWKNNLHRAYSIFVLIFMILYSMSVAASLFLFATENFNIFWQKIIETFMLAACTMEMIIMNYKLSQYLKLMSPDPIISCHPENNTVVRLKQMEKRIVFVAMGLILSVLVLLIISHVRPKSEEDLKTLGTIYKIQNPQNTFIFHVYVPCLDPSISPWCFVFYVLDSYILAQMTLIVFGSILFPALLLPLKAKFELLCQFIERTGHYKDGDDIFYINLVKNMRLNQYRMETQDERIRQRLDFIHNLFQRNPKAYEYFYMKQIIIFQKQLLKDRDELEAFWLKIFLRQGGLAICLLLMSMNNIANQHDSSKLHLVTISFEVVAFLTGYICYFHCCELIAECNLSLAAAKWCSQWYQCSRETKKATLFFLRHTLTPHYFTFPLNFKLGYEYMVGTFKLSYSFLNLMRVSKVEK